MISLSVRQKQFLETKHLYLSVIVFNQPYRDWEVGREREERNEGGAFEPQDCQNVRKQS